jgi:hypothetical protein
MCNFFPGECIGIAPAGMVAKLRSDWVLPGNLYALPLLFENADIPVDPTGFGNHELLHVRGIPAGLEVLTVSKLSAMLANEIATHRAVVELNYLLPLSTLPAFAPDPGFTPPAEALVKLLRRSANKAVAAVATPPTIGMLDSGINPSGLRTTRALYAYDYAGGRAERIEPSSDMAQSAPRDHDGLGHGTDVLRILDAIMPETVQIASGRIATTDADVTVLQLARAFAHLVAAASPAVVNLSLAPRDDVFFCPHCRRTVPVPAFHSMLLPFVFNLAADRAIPVMAAGNQSGAANPRLFVSGVQPPLFAVAAGSSGARAAYSNYVEADLARSLSAFGGDPVGLSDGCGVFASNREAVGTSFAAPFVTGAVVIATLGRIGAAAPWGQDPGFYDACRYILGTWTPELGPPKSDGVPGGPPVAITDSPSRLLITEDWISIDGVKIPARR